ncbi:MAG: ThiF family adenylyltransferase [Holophaga sp.]
MDRYRKQRIYLGAEADARLRTARVVLVGLGATGSVIAPWLVRAGVGHLTIIDRDIVEESNLQRQLLYGENDLLRPKAEAAAARLREANSEVEIRPVIADLTSGTARELLTGFDLILDGTDNFEARYLINDIAILTGTPWIYAGALGAEGMVWPIHPPHTPCLRCLMEDPPASGDVDTCDSAGVLGPAVGVIGSWAALEALKVLTGKAPHTELARFDFWRNERQFIQPPRTRCHFCSEKITEFLDARWSLRASRLCGLEGIQIRVNPPSRLDLEALLTRFEARTGQPWKLSTLALSGQEGAWRVVLFRDGRALIHGDLSPEKARAWYSETVGC